jgi:hypothetical protein
MKAGEEENKPIKVVSKTTEGGVEVSYIKGGEYEQVQVHAGATDTSDPRVGGSKIIFDSRLDKFQTS